MVLAYDNWERLVRATLLREELRQIARQCSTASSISSEFPPGFHSFFLNFSKISKSFEYEQIQNATDSFADKHLIKCGFSGDLFRGKLDSSTSVVIKRIDLLLVSPYEYISELEFYSKVAHSGFVRLLGHCFEDEDIKFLVYEYVPNGDLSSFSFTKPNGNIGLKLWSWRTRMQIAIGTAKSLVYLHHECNPPLVHGDVQASSILLDDNYDVKLGSLSRACNEENTLLDRITRTYQEDSSYQEDTFSIGSWASGVSRFGKVLVELVTRKRGISTRSDVQSNAVPISSDILKLIYEEDASGLAIGSCESDVYCFGKVLLVLVTGKLGISAKSDVMAQDWLQVMLRHIDEDNKTSIIDPSLLISNVCEFDNLWAVAGLAKSCLDPVPSSRPQMKSVLKDLEDLNNLRTYHE
ncbi:probable LRR receptor-like serine threonine-kinase At2g16250 [Olea europaea subsp. europaea]|uniref:Probable LRR receptor-like serine threonine-kinase At2g16250 n=2 Tax=Olea europaea subsp. europaea TaxID=158383 RepID=A0A8S0SVW7_OLEEU|nr:probable LRR receptor-like serine threonine-kinase At2g16250 [Olea europaea subsp. europaea]